jgi:murein DD-endopeptidase MepM/ murein hydrolase activator NlpD
MHRRTTRFALLSGLIRSRLTRRGRRRARAIAGQFARLPEQQRGPGLPPALARGIPVLIEGAAIAIRSVPKLISTSTEFVLSLPALARDVPALVRALPALVRPGLRLVTSALVVAGFVAAAIALISATAAKPGPITATAGDADRAAAAARADRGDRSPANPADGATPAPTADTGPGLQAQPARVLDWVSPMPGTPLSSCYGARWGSVHQGIDFAAPGGTPIHAAGKGVVFGAGWLYAGYGISVVIDHGNGIFTHYAHLSRAFVVEGQPVNVSDIIGLEGSTGDSTGPHLHFEIHQGLWHQIDPAPWLRQHGVPSAC